MERAVFEIVVILLLVICNGVFAMSELAVVSARRSRLRQLADEGHPGAETAFTLSQDPNRFLSTVQVGITFIGTFAGVFGGATLAEELANTFAVAPAIAPYSEAISLVIVVGFITLLSLILGELVPKRIALSNPEQIATLVARPLSILSTVASPVVRVLGACTDFFLRLLGIPDAPSEIVTEDELKVLIEQGAESGVLEEAEEEIVQSVFSLDVQPCRAVMTHRKDVVWLEVNATREEILEAVKSNIHSRLPVCEGGLEHTQGYIQIATLLTALLERTEIDLRSMLHTPLFIYEGTSLLKVLEQFKNSTIHFGMVIDEYGSVIGVVTLQDILTAIVGDLPTHGEVPRAVQREDGSWLLDGSLSTSETLRLLEISELPAGDFDTLAGLVVTQLGKIPDVAESFAWQHLVFEVVDMDGKRVDKVLVRHAEPLVPEEHL